MNGIGVTTIHLNRFDTFDIPKNNLMVETGAEKKIFRGRMPFDVVDTTLMTVQIDFPLVEIEFQTFGRNRPNLHGTIV